MADLKGALLKHKPFFSDPEATHPRGKPCEVSRERVSECVRACVRAGEEGIDV